MYETKRNRMIDNETHDVSGKRSLIIRDSDLKTHEVSEKLRSVVERRRQ